MSAVSKQGFETLPAEVERMRTREDATFEAPHNTNLILDPQAFAAYKVDNSLDVTAFRAGLKIVIKECTEDTIVFDMIGIDAPLANAFRRILLSEIPTMAVEKVTIYQNTSIIQDEILAHRLGLVPIKVDPRRFEYVPRGGANNSKNTVVFVLRKECTAKPGVTSTAPPSEKYNHSTIYSSDFEWIPQGKQAEVFPEGMAPVHDDIIVAKMRPGQAIEAELLCEKGVGQTHAKWSPVSTASYRLMPEVRFRVPIVNDDAKKLVDLCPANVFDIEDLGGRKGTRARVVDPRACTMCRECIREPAMRDQVDLTRIKNHFIFSIESTGVYKPEELLHEALQVLKTKCASLLQEMKK